MSWSLPWALDATTANDRDSIHLFDLRPPPKKEKTLRSELVQELALALVQENENENGNVDLIVGLKKRFVCVVLEGKA